jgi:hypothetical protein
MLESVSSSCLNSIIACCASEPARGVVIAQLPTLAGVAALWRLFYFLEGKGDSKLPEGRLPGPYGAEIRAGEEIIES